MVVVLSALSVVLLATGIVKSGTSAEETNTAVSSDSTYVSSDTVNLAMGVSNATVNIEGKNRLRIEMPGVKDAKSAIKRIGETAKLKFTLADGTEYLTGGDVKTAQAEADSENGGYKITMN